MRKFGVLLAAIIFLSSTGFVYASENPYKEQVSEKLQQKLEDREERLQELMEGIKERNQTRTASREAKLSQLKKNLVLKYYNNMSKRLWATIARLDTLVSRIESRIAVVDTQTDKDLTSVNADMTKAKGLLTDSKALLTSSDASMSAKVMESTSPKDAFAIVKLNILDIKNNLKEVHKLLVHVIGDIEGLRVGTLKVSPTVTVTP